MHLLTEEIQKMLPELYATENEDDPIVWVKFFTPDSCWTWYVLEGSEQENVDWLLFAYVEGMFNESGYVSLRELENVIGPLGLGVERDITFTPIPLSKVLTQKCD